ncbi:hypothetical protein CVT24_013226 [Panaeolus cyanescens]|uniref:DUF6699 domain-containing protein n=1 Tax=Panaeolus cyanescens TaxID=181874 RepID=A0A409YN11_9AGAR|nr:hypothetical protein CVT24_013226 [Panaeolus cyanescens]
MDRYYRESSRRSGAHLHRHRETTTSHSHQSYHLSTTSMPTSIVMSNVPLPLITSETVAVNYSLRYSSAPCINYDLNKRPDRASLSSSMVNPHAPDYAWYSAPALSPTQLTSFTVRITGVEHPVVIVLSPPMGRGVAGVGYITVWEVLKACYDAWSRAKQECHAILEAHQAQSSYPTENSSRLWRTDNQSLYYSSSSYNQAMARLSYLRSHGIWAGLEPSSTERDVWILHTRAGRQAH